MCPCPPCPNLLATSLAMELLTITSTFRDVFSYRVRTVAEATPCQDYFWDQFLAKWPKISNSALQEILRTHNTPRFLLQGNAAS